MIKFLAAMSFFTVYVMNVGAYTDTEMKRIIIAQAIRQDVPPLLMVEVCNKESNLNWDAKGLDTSARRKPKWKRNLNDYSYGLCQVKIETARWVWKSLVPNGVKRSNIEVWDLYNPEFNARTASIYMKWLHKRYKRYRGRGGCNIGGSDFSRDTCNWLLALTAYNHGPKHTLTYFRRNIYKGDYRRNLSYAVSIYMRWLPKQNLVNFYKIDDVIGIAEISTTGKINRNEYALIH